MSVSRIVHNSQHCRKASFGTSRHGYRLRSSEPNATSLAFCRKQNSVSLCSQRSSKSLSSGIELAQVAFDLDSETITTIVAAVLGVGAGLGVPIFFVMQEERDKERLEEIRELNRATLKATGEQMSEEEITDLRPSRYLDRREFKDDD